jgi:hypothetical protein
MRRCEFRTQGADAAAADDGKADLLTFDHFASRTSIIC